MPVSLAELNGTLRTGSKSVLADVMTEDIDCPETIHLHGTSSCLIIDGQVLIVAQPEHGAPKQLDQSDGLYMEGHDVPLPKDWSNFLSIAVPKVDLSHFLSEELCSQAPEDNEIIVAGDLERNSRSSRQKVQLI